LTQGFIAISVLYILCKMLGDEEGHCNLQYPKSPQCRARMKVERAKSHERRKAGYKSSGLWITRFTQQTRSPSWVGGRWRGGYRLSLQALSYELHPNLLNVLHSSPRNTFLMSFFLFIDPSDESLERETGIRLRSDRV
jgi:hypothetical protein